MKFYLGVGFALLVQLASAVPQEVVTFSTPIQVDPGATRFRVSELFLRRTLPSDRGPTPTSEVPAVIRAVLHEVDSTGAFVVRGKEARCEYSGTVAEGLLKLLNTADLPTKSLERRVIERCTADGKLGAGVISGVPE